MGKLIQKIKKHKIITVLAILILSGGGYYAYGKFTGDKAVVSYATAAVEKGTLIASISGSGQISVLNQVDIKAKVSGDITKIAVKSGQQVKAGDLIAQLDARDAYKTVRDAKANLESAEIAYDKLVQPATADEKFQADNAVKTAQSTLEKLKLSQPIDYQNAQDDFRTAEKNLTKAYTDTFNAISNTFLNLPNIIAALNDILYSDKISMTESSVDKGYMNTSVIYNTTYKSEAEQIKVKTHQTYSEADYAAARQVYDNNYQNFKNASLYSEPAEIEDLLAETLATTKAIAQAIKSENNYLNAWYDSRISHNLSVFTQVSTYLANLSTYVSQTNSSLSSLLSAQATIQSDKEAITAANNALKTLTQNQPLDLAAAEASLKEKRAAYASLLAGADALDIRTQQLSLQQKKNSLSDAEQALADYIIRAPFDGIIASVDLQAGDSASGAIATLITAQKIAEISLNEVDVAKINAGNKVTLSFDAIDGLTISGKVAEIDSVGAVSQGVVTYNVKISFDTQDSRIKPGMSANATIITDVKTDVLIAPNSAVKTNNSGGSYVQALNADGQPENIAVQIGLASDTSTEILSGLNEGDKVITQTINSSAKTTDIKNSRGVGSFMMGGPRN